MLIKNLIRKDDFYHHFQPIYNLKDGCIVGYEALFRSNYYKDPEETFALAAKVKRLYELDSRSIHKAVSTYHSAGLLSKRGKLFVNVFPSTISNPKFPSLLNQIISEYPGISQQLIIEISEKEIINFDKMFINHLTITKKLGIQLAIDDVGKGHSNFQSIVELEPYYMKLDQFFSKNLHTSPQKQIFIRHVLNYCKESNITFVLEGIENREELISAESLGVPFAQGYILGRPSVLAYVGGDRL